MDRRTAQRAAALRISSLSCRSLGGVHLQDASLVVREGDCVVLRDQERVEAAALLDCIYGVGPPHRGRIQIYGREYGRSDKDLISLRRKIGFVRTGPSFHPTLTVMENLARHPGSKRRANMARAEELLWRMRIPEVAGYLTDELLLHQQRIAALVQALMAHPKILLIDGTPLTQSHKAARSLFWRLTELASDGMTMLVATNHEGFAKRSAGMICQLDGGKIVAAGPPNLVFEGDYQETRSDENRPRPLSIAAKIIIHLSRQPSGVTVTHRDFKYLAGRETLNNVLRRLADQGWLRRLRRGDYAPTRDFPGHTEPWSASARIAAYADRRPVGTVLRPRDLEQIGTPASRQYGASSPSKPSAQIRLQALTLPDGKFLRAKDLLSFGSRDCVDKVLSELARCGVLERVARGRYAKPADAERLRAMSRDARSEPSSAKRRRAKLRAWAEERRRRQTPTPTAERRAESEKRGALENRSCS